MANSELRMENADLEKLSKLARYYCLISTTAAKSGHLTSSLSAVDLMVGLMFGGFFRFRLGDPGFANNDRLVFSKGHAAPLLYALFALAGEISEEELKHLRSFDSPLEGHPTMRFRYTEAATGSLGQGLSIGVGMALNAKMLDKLPYRTFVLLGDSEMSEGSVWEAMQAAAYYKLGNLVGIIDVNGLGQRGETMYGQDVENYRRKVEAFGWKAVVIDGHNTEEIREAYRQATEQPDVPVMIIARTVKGKGVPEWEGQNGYHSKQLTEEQLGMVLEQMGGVDKNIRGVTAAPEDKEPQQREQTVKKEIGFAVGDMIATKKAFGMGLMSVLEQNPQLVVLDGEVSNSTHTDIFAKQVPDRFFEMFIMEQNMLGVAVGMSARMKKPVVSTFGAFLTRAFDHIRMAQYSETNMLVAGSYAGVSLGMDGSSQMALEDLAMMRAIRESIVLYPADAVATVKLLELAAVMPGISYLRLTREETPVLYGEDEMFEIGGSKTLKQSEKDVVTVVAAGITVVEALKAYEQLYGEGIMIRVIDLYSVKPVDAETLRKAVRETRALITVEDHYAAGGLGEAVVSALAGEGIGVPVHQLAVKKMPRSGKPRELLRYEEIDAEAIVVKVREVLSNE